MTTPTHLLVGNPTAQSGRNAARIEKARKLLADAGIISDVLPTLPGGKTIGAVREALVGGSYRVAITMGGDGTFREVAAGLMASGRCEEIALAMLPTGTANDQGRSFGLDAAPRALPRNVAVIAAGHETRLDAGRIWAVSDSGSPIAEDVFFDSAGWGMSARVLARRNVDRRTVDRLGPLKEVYRDQLVYAGAFLSTFLKSYVVSDKFVAEIIADGKVMVLDRLTDLVIKNTRIYGGAWVFDRSSKHDDGLFEIVSCRGKRDWTSKAIVDLHGNPITEDHLNKIGVSHSKTSRGRRIEIRFMMPKGRAPLAAQIDGEEFPASERVVIEAVPRAIRLVVPGPA